MAKAPKILHPMWKRKRKLISRKPIRKSIIWTLFNKVAQQIPPYFAFLNHASLWHNAHPFFESSSETPHRKPEMAKAPTDLRRQSYYTLYGR
jgi:hypothetical protein